MTYIPRWKWLMWAAMAAAVAGCTRDVVVLYADQPTVHVVRSYAASAFGRVQCRSDRDALAFNHPTITFHCDREEHG